MQLNIPWTKVGLLSLVLLLGLALSSCGGVAGGQGQDGGVDIAFASDPNPPSVGPSHLDVTLTGAGGQPLDGATVKIEAHIGEVCMQPLRVSLRAGESGTYGGPFNWTAGGDWIMVVKATLPDGQELEREFNVAVEGETSAQGHDRAETEVKRIPNDGAVIRIVSPEDGASFEAGTDVRVVVEFDHFDLSDEGNHWHVYLDGQSRGMIMGGMTDAVLRDLEPGQHELSAYMSVGKFHDELEDAAVASITILDPGAGSTSASSE